MSTHSMLYLGGTFNISLDGLLLSENWQGITLMLHEKCNNDILSHNVPIDSEQGQKRVYAAGDDNIITQKDPIIAILA